MSNVLLGTAVGDALGVPFETKLVNFEPLLAWDGKTFLGSQYHGLLPGQYSDDTQMSLMVAESLIENHGFNPDDLSARYVDWMTSGRWRGHGRTTKMALESLLSGTHWSESGVPGSLGNGTAMRAAPFGVYFRNDIKSLVSIVKIDSAITHASDDAEAGALAIALTAAFAVNDDLDDLLNRLVEYLPDSKVKSSIASLDSLVNSEYINAQQALRVLGTKANVKETVPSVLYCFLKFTDYHEAVEASIRAGGDTDTTAAIVGALIGARDGMKVIDRSFYSVEDFDQLVALDSQLFNRTAYNFFPREV